MIIPNLELPVETAAAGAGGGPPDDDPPPLLAAAFPLPADGPGPESLDPDSMAC